METTVRDRKRNVLEAAKIAVDELILVLKEPILDGNSADPLGAEKMKTAAQSKRVAFEDALAILEGIQNEENNLDDTKVDENIKDQTPFAERKSKK
jgi:hypothetical protein